jgi:hypothetical protein
MNYKLLILLMLCFVPVVSAAQTWNLHFSDGTTTINATDICVADGTCLTSTAGGDITAVNTAGPYLSGGAVSGAVSLLFNSSALNITIDALSIGNLSFNETWTNTLYADIGVVTDNKSWNETLADTLYRTATWDNFTGIPTATPTNGDVTHLSTADQIYDWVISLSYATSSYVESLGNWSSVSSQYWNTSTDIDTVLSADEISEANIAFSTACSAGNYYRLNGNDLECTTPGTYNSTYGALVTDNSSWGESYASGLYVNLSGDIMTGILNMSNNSIIDVADINVGKVNATCCLYVGTIQATDGNSIAIQPTGDVDDYFLFKTVSNRPTIKREGGKFIYFDSSNVYDVGISLRDDDTYSGTLNYEKDTHKMTLLGKNSSVAIKTNSEYVNYFLFETYGHQPILSVFNGSILQINDTLEVNGDINSTGNYYGDGSLLTGIIHDNSSWNEVRGNSLYADISVVTDNSTWNEVRSDTLYRTATWNNFTGIPTAAITNGDTTHLSTADQIYDWAVGLFLQAMDYTNVALTNSSETFESNVTMNELVFNNSVSHSIRDNATCISIGGSTSRFEIC